MVMTNSINECFSLINGPESRVTGSILKIDNVVTDRISKAPNAKVSVQYNLHWSYVEDVCPFCSTFVYIGIKDKSGYCFGSFENKKPPKSPYLLSFEETLPSVGSNCHLIYETYGWTFACKRVVNSPNIIGAIWTGYPACPDGVNACEDTSLCPSCSSYSPVPAAATTPPPFTASLASGTVPSQTISPSVVGDSLNTKPNTVLTQTHSFKADEGISNSNSDLFVIAIIGWMLSIVLLAVLMYICCSSISSSKKEMPEKRDPTVHLENIYDQELNSPDTINPNPVLKSE